MSEQHAGDLSSANGRHVAPGQDRAGGGDAGRGDGTDVRHDHHLDGMIPQEAGDSGVMRSLGALVVEAIPANLDLVPADDLAALHFGHGHAIGTSPARGDLPIRSEVDADHHSKLLQR